MTVTFDASILLLFLYPEAKSPLNPETREVVDKSKERINYLIKNLEKDKLKIIIPTPVLSEVLVYAEEASLKYIKILDSEAVFKIADFNKLAAIETAELAREDLTKRDRSDKNITQAKLKFDRQIIAITKVNGADTIYSDDINLSKRAKRAGLKVIGIAELPLPPENDEPSLDF